MAQTGNNINIPSSNPSTGTGQKGGQMSSIRQGGQQVMMAPQNLGGTSNLLGANSNSQLNNGSDMLASRKSKFIGQ